MITASSTLCPVTYPSPTSSSKMVDMLDTNYPTTSSDSGVRNRSRGRRAKKGQETSWVYLNALEDFSNVRTRDRLMNAYNSSSSDDEPVPRSVPASLPTVTAPAQPGIDLSTSATHFHPNLHALHKDRRERKKGLVSDKNVVISYRPRVRLNLSSRRNFYYRMSDKELDALKAFSFLDDIFVSSPEESGASFSDYLFAMDYEQEDDDQKQISMKDDEVVLDEHLPNIRKDSSLIELVPGVIGNDLNQRSGSLENDVKTMATTEVLIATEESCIPWTEEDDTVTEFSLPLREGKGIELQLTKTDDDVIDVGSDPVEDDGFHDKQVQAPPSPPLSVLDRLSLSDSCTESYFGSDSGGSSFLGGK